MELEILRSKSSPSGLDSRKAVIVKDMEYIDSSVSAVVDPDEYTATISNIEKIVCEANEYVDSYVNHIKQTSVLHTREFTRQYKYSTLQYFHNILGLNN